LKIISSFGKKLAIYNATHREKFIGILTSFVQFRSVGGSSYGLRIPILRIIFCSFVKKSMDKHLLNRITINPEISHGRPTIRNTRYTVDLILDLLSSGMSESEIIEDYPALESNDIKACLALTEKQVLMLQLSDNDLNNGKLISHDQLDKEDLQWLKGL
jgi:uncharacterized protein (DUF433 family)